MNQPRPEAVRRFEIPQDAPERRLDKALVELDPTLSRARARTLVEEGQVRVNGHRARKGAPVLAGDVVEFLAEPPPRDFSPVPEAGPTVTVLHEDPSVVVFDKPAGMPSHPLRPDETGTLANVVLARYPETRDVGFALREPGLTHRLDTDTSGLVLVARTKAAFDHVRESSRAGRIQKKYMALVAGEVPAEGRIEYPLVPHRKDPRRVESVTPHVRLRAGTRVHEARTHYRPLRVVRAAFTQAEHEGGPGVYTLVEVWLSSAFRHQVRAHLATIGHPLLGDALYRGPTPAPETGLTRHFLHACEIRLPHPSSGHELTVTSPLPEDLARLVP